MKAYQIVDADFVKREIGRMPIVDVRPPLRYDPAHIPSAINIRLDVAAASEDPAEELAEMFQDNGIFPEDAVRRVLPDGRACQDRLRLPGVGGLQ